METLPITARSFEHDYHIKGDIFERAYKEHLSGYFDWSELEYAGDWPVFPQNIGPYLSIDETCLSIGEVYTILSNKDAHGRKGCIVAIVKGTKADVVIKALKRIPIEQRSLVEEVTLDFSDSMHRIVDVCFPNAMLTLDRTHHQQFCLEAMQEVRREHRREQMTRDANARDEHKAMMNELRQSDGPFVDEDGNSIRKNARYYPPRLNMFNGEIISYTISGSPDLKMVTNMLDKAFKKEANLNGLIFHSDQG